MRLSIAFTIDSVEFTAGILAGTTSLGGSESACVGLARALARRGHRVSIFASKIADTCPRVDAAGVQWFPYRQMSVMAVAQDWDVLVALRMPHPLGELPAKWRVLWSQDLMSGEDMKQHVMGTAWAYDEVAYVSAYHRKQWEGVVPELSKIGYVTRNGFDPTLVTRDVPKRPNQIIHISRPERGLAPLLQMWPALRQAAPEATLALCRYSSMYDPTGWGDVCRRFDELVASVNDQIGGITYLGELGKPALYQAIAESAVMWYPGIAGFAETSCIAAIESQANGTPFVGSWKGALPETVPGGVLIKGDAEKDEAYQRASIEAVLHALAACRNQTFGYRQVQQQGCKHVAGYTYDAIAAEWEAHWLEAFAARYELEKPAILARLMHEDDCVSARLVAEELADTATIAECDRAIAGLEHTAADYAERALDPRVELACAGPRLKAVESGLAGAKRVVDVACGSGAFAIALALADPERHITAIDYAADNIAAGQAAAASLGVAGQITWDVAPVWDFATQRPSPWWLDFAAEHAGAFDGLWCGEFIEHVADCALLVDALEGVVAEDGRLVWSCPFGPLVEIAERHRPYKRSHVHHFRPADLAAVFGQKRGFDLALVVWPSRTPTNATVGNWLVSYRRGQAPTGDRPLERRQLARPYRPMSAGLILNDTIDVRRCLESIYDVVDEIVLGDCGANRPALEQLLAEYPRKTRLVDVGPVQTLYGGFAEARNRVLAACTGHWFLWIDADERLCGAPDLAKYRDSAVYEGFVILQQHLHLDTSPARTTDTPTRLFRRREDIEFYGCIHEQPQMGDCNTDIIPTLQVNDVQIAHTGYLHESVRREKALGRNLPLLARDRQVFKERELGKLLVLREHSNLALWKREASQGELTDEIKAHLTQVVGLYEELFADPKHRFHELARPFYQAALPEVAGAMEVEIGLAGAIGALGTHHAKPERAWFRTPEQLRAYLHAKIDMMLAGVGPAAALDLEPIDTSEAVSV